MVRHKSEIVNIDGPAIKETKVLMSKLLETPEFAKMAVHDRNFIIKSLKANLEHKRIAYKELEERYELLIDNNIKMEEDIKLLKNEIEKNKKESIILKDKYDDQYKKLVHAQIIISCREKEDERLFISKVKKICNLIGGWKGAIIRFLILPPMIYFLILIVYLLTLLASFIGWQPIFNFSHSIWNIFG